MKLWEYKIVDSQDVGGGIFKGPDRDKLEAYLNEPGQDGWEILGVDFLELENRHSFVAIAKRAARSRWWPRRENCW